MKLNTPITTHTNGHGLWSTVAKMIRIVEIFLNYYDGEDGQHGELCAVFHPDDWHEDDGLIYTDELWQQEFRAGLREMGLSANAAKDVGYSEAGMQDAHYVSLDVDEVFFNSGHPVVKQLLDEYRKERKAKKKKKKAKPVVEIIEAKVLINCLTDHVEVETPDNELRGLLSVGYNSNTLVVQETGPNATGRFARQVWNKVSDTTTLAEAKPIMRVVVFRKE